MVCIQEQFIIKNGLQYCTSGIHIRLLNAVSQGFVFGKQRLFNLLMLRFLYFSCRQSYNYYSLQHSVPIFSTFLGKIFLKSNIRPWEIFLKSNNLCTKKSVVPTIFLKSRFFLKSGFLKSRFHCTGCLIDTFSKYPDQVV